MSAEMARREVRHVEDLDETLAEILEFASRKADEYRSDPKNTVYRSTDDDFPVVTQALTERLRVALSEEVIAAVPPDDEGRIRQAEVDREVIKKALIGLRSEALKRIAADAGIAKSGRIEKLAESVAASIGWNPDEVARLVLENEEVIRPDRGYSSRLFPLRDRPDMDTVRERLGYVDGRYIRTAVAKWFVFKEVVDGGDSLELLGAQRTYEATIDDRNLAAPRLIPSASHDATARMVISDSDLLHVRNASLGVARAGVIATAEVSQIEPLYRVPFIDTNAPSAPGELHDASKFILDLLVNRLPAKGLTDFNLTVVRFKLKDAEESGEEDDGAPRRATLKAVRIEGDYLLGSVQACQLLAVDQRPLSDVTIQVRLRNREQIIIGRYPVRISIEKDHIAVETSFGTNVEASAGVHSDVTSCVVDEISNGFGNEDRLDEFAEKIRLRAHADESEDLRDLLGDDLV